MKLDQLVTSYLYQSKRLSLPGIGTFTTDGTSVQFDNKADANISEEFIEYVKSNTGKMYSLAQADIESFIMLNQQFLNIGKSLYLEGIGTIVKAREGSLEFTPGEMVVEKLEDVRHENRPHSVFEDDRRFQDQSVDVRKWLIALGTLLTIFIIGWGSWKLFLKNDNENDLSTRPAPQVDTARIVTDSTRFASDSLVTGDTTKQTHLPAMQQFRAANSSWHFVIEQTNSKTRAFKRYNQLKVLGKNVKMETTDSVTYKIFFELPATPADTAKIKDSLRLFYNAKVSVEQK